MAMNIPDIIIYGPSEGPPHMRYAAAMVPRTIPAKGKVPAHTEPGTSWICTAPSPEAARDKLIAQWHRDHPDTSWRGAHLRKPKAESVDDLLIVL